MSLINNIYLFNRELVITLTELRKLTSKYCHAYLNLVQVCSCHIYQNILSIKCYLSLLWVNDWWQWQHSSILIIENWIDWTLINDMQVFTKFLIFWQYFKKFLGIHFLSLFKCLESYLLRWKTLISDRSLNFVIIMSSHRTQCSLSTDVLMKFIL
jgi:hypothetical protein